jgi:hypothetical protein
MTFSKSHSAVKTDNLKRYLKKSYPILESRSEKEGKQRDRENRGENKGAFILPCLTRMKT